MENVVYNMYTFKIHYTSDEDICISKLKETEDFMSIELWNSSSNKINFPTITEK